MSSPVKGDAFLAEQSATTVTLRALVMLSCVVVIPLVALLGTSLPDQVRSFLADADVKQTDQTGEVPPFSPPGETATARAPGRFASSPFGPSNPQTRPDGSRRRESRDSHALAHEAMTPRAASPWGQSSDSHAWSNPRPQTNALPVGYTSGEQPSFERSSEPSSGRLPAWPGQTQVAGGPSNAGTPDLGSASDQASQLPPGGVGMTPMAGTVDRFTRVQRQLRQLGVTYSSLETWGDQGLYYRFQCRVAVGGDPTLARPFQATDTDAVRAMTTVLHQVQQWRAGSL